MKFRKLNQQGFTQSMIIIGFVVVVAIGGVFYMVLKNPHGPKASVSTQTNSQQDQSKLSSNPSTASGASAVANASGGTNTPNTASPKPTTNSTKSTTSTSGSNNNSTPPPTQTPLSVLTALISDLDNGAQVDITASVVSVPGPISTAQARPIVFTANGQLYFAYHQGSAANFTTSASQTASSMAIVNATVSNPSLVQAHLDKASNLVDPNISSYLVGYSTGGN